jgi:hypothetical protein
MHPMIVHGVKQNLAGAARRLKLRIARFLGSVREGRLGFCNCVNVHLGRSLKRTLTQNAGVTVSFRYCRSHRTIVQTSLKEWNGLSPWAFTLSVCLISPSLPSCRTCTHWGPCAGSALWQSSRAILSRPYCRRALLPSPKDGFRRRDRQARAAISFGVGQKDVCCIVGGVGQNVQTVPPAVRVHDRHRTPTRHENIPIAHGEDTANIS